MREHQTYSERMLQKALKERMRKRYEQERACQEEMEYLSEIAVDLMAFDPEDRRRKGRS